MGTPHPRSSSRRGSIHSRSWSPEIPSVQNTQIRRQRSEILGREYPWQDNVNKTRTDFADEMIDTVRYLVQHGLMTTISLMRLFALPLVYIVQTLGWPQDRAWLAAIPPPIPQATIGTASTRPTGTGGTVRTSGPSIANIMSLPFRMTRDLYRICNLLQQNPGALERIGSRHERQRLEISERHNFQDRSSRFLHDCGTHDLASVPAPSEIYHAAVSERGDLDEVLAAFECPSSHESVIGDDHQLKPQETGDLDQLRSLQNTPPEITGLVNQRNRPALVRSARSHPSGFACFDSLAQANRDSSVSPSTEKIAYTPKLWDKLARMDDQRHTSLPDECMGRDTKELLGNTEILERCPTYVKRHRRSILPRMLGTRSVLNLGSGGSQLAQEAVANTSTSAPEKSAKLKKRRPVPVPASNSSRTSLQWRY
jgi:hypothetical protein